MEKMRILIACDHAGVDLKNHIINVLSNFNVEIIDLGTNDAQVSVDYPDFAHKLAQNLKEDDFGILICGTGIGISIAANRHSNIRCALCENTYSAIASREHNNANVLALGARVTTKDIATQILLEFINTKFDGGRHIKRIEKINLGV